jgi:hypothetical protein
MTENWPNELPTFELFLREKGLVCRRRGRIPRYGEHLALYGDGKISVRVLSEKGQWFTEVADNAGRPEEWYDAAILRDLVQGSGEDVLSLAEQMKVIEDNWSAITNAFRPEHREHTHQHLGLLRKQRAKRRFPALEGQ